MEIFEWASNFNNLSLNFHFETPEIWTHSSSSSSMLFYIHRDCITLTVHGLLQYWGQGAQEAHLDFHTAPEFSMHTSSPLRLYNRHDWLGVNIIITN